MKILSEFISDDVLSNLLIEAYMHEIICGVYRIFSRRYYRSYLLSGSNNADEKLVYDVINYIDVNLESMENLSALSSAFGYSYTHIAQKVFCADRGKPQGLPHEASGLKRRMNIYARAIRSPRSPS